MLSDDFSLPRGGEDTLTGPIFVRHRVPANPTGKKTDAADATTHWLQQSHDQIPIYGLAGALGGLALNGGQDERR